MTDSEKHQNDPSAENEGAAHGHKSRTDADFETGDPAEDSGQGAGSSRKHSETWSEAQEAFERLNVEEKAFFLVESAFDTVLSGLKEAGDAVKDAMEEALSDLEKRKQEARRRANREDDAPEEDSGETSADDPESKNKSHEPASDQSDPTG